MFTAAIIGRPNVGKSTLFNRLVGRKLALVDDTPGVTRDRRVHAAKLYDLHFDVVDTAGFEDSGPETLAGRMRAQTDIAIREADIILFLVDAKAGIVPDDKAFAQIVRRSGKPVVLVANKAEARGAQSGLAEAWEIGFGEPIPVSAEHGQGMPDLRDAIVEALGEDRALPPEEEPDVAAESQALVGEDIADPEAEEPAYDDSKPLRIAVVGRPNAGKSTLINAMIGEDRLLTGPEAGITRDSISVDWTWRNRRIKLFDTAGMRRKAKVQEKLERMSVGETLHAIRFADVCVLVMDSEEPFAQQDLSIGDLVVREGRALVIVLAKWDKIEDTRAQFEELKLVAKESLPQARGAPLVTVAAQAGVGLDRLMKAVLEAHTDWTARVKTNDLNNWLHATIARHPPPAVRGRRIKPRYIAQVKARPPTFVLIASRAEEMPESYKRYLVNGIRDAFDLHAAPVRLIVKANRNPFDEKGED